jgi:hypothetical protein
MATRRGLENSQASVVLEAPINRQSAAAIRRAHQRRPQPLSREKPGRMAAPSLRSGAFTTN